MSCESCDIKNLIYRYADYLDRGELDHVASLFHAGKIIARAGNDEDVEIVGAEAVEAMYRSFTRLYEDNGTPHTKHVTTNVIVDVEEGGMCASARSYAVVFQSLEDFPLQPIIGVRYFDRFERVDGSWRFTERRIDSDQFGDLSRHLLQDP